MSDVKIIVLDADALRALLTDAIGEALERYDGGKPERGLLTCDECAQLLGVSLPTLGRLRQQPGFPELRLLESPRFERDAVLAWVRARSAKRGSK